MFLLAVVTFVAAYKRCGFFAYGLFVALYEGMLGQLRGNCGAA